MEIKQLTHNHTLTEEEHHAIVLFKGEEVQFRVTKVTSISTRGTCFTAVSIKKIGYKPNLTKGQKEKIREFIQQNLEK